MKKLLLILVVCLAVGLLVTPKLIESRIERVTVDALLDLVPVEAYSIMQVTLDEYQPGWFSSQAQVAFRMSELYELDGESPALLLKMNIKHGPLLFTPSGIRLGLAYADIEAEVTGMETEAFQELQELAQIEASPPVSYLYAGFGDQLQIVFEMDRFSTSADGVSLAVDNLLLHLTLYSDNSADFTFNLDSIGVNAPSQATNLAITDIIATTRTEDYTRYGAPSESTFVIGQITGNEPGMESMLVENLRVDYTITESTGGEPDFIDTAMTLEVANMDWAFPVRSARWHTELNHIDSGLMNDYYTLITEAQAASGDDPALLTEEMTALAMELAIGFFRERFEFNNNVEANAYNGNHRLELLIGWSGMPDLADIESLDPRQAIDALDVTLGVDADYAALMRSPIAEMVAQYQQEGMLVLDNGRVRVDGRLTNGVLRVNGETLPIDEMLGIQ